jgi:hypothetical protein
MPTGIQNSLKGLTLKQITDFPSFTTWMIDPFAKDARGRPSNGSAWKTFQLLVFLSKGKGPSYSSLS